VAFFASWGLPLSERIAALEKVVKAHPDYSPAYNILAYDSWSIREEGDALEYAAKYVKAAPDHPNPYDTHGEILQWSGMLSKAAKSYQKAVELNPDYAEGYAGIADVYQMMGKGDAARAQLDKAIEHAASEQQRLNYTRQKGHSYLHDGDYKNASKTLASVAEGADAAGMSWMVAASHATLAAADAVMGKGKKVTEHLDAAEASGGMAPWMHILKFLALTHSGDDAGAAETLAAFKDATNPATGLGSVAHALDAMVQLKAGEADAALESVLASGVDNPFERTIMAKCHAAAGNTAEAAGFKAAVVYDHSWSLNGTIEPLLKPMLSDV
jgi:tetratricopeptide (TPR) repeat protein